MIVVLAILRAVLGLALGADRVACPAGWWSESLRQRTTAIALVECVYFDPDPADLVTQNTPPRERLELPIVCRVDRLRRDDGTTVRCAP